MRSLPFVFTAALALLPRGSLALDCGDLNGTGEITTTDALLLLRKAVGQPVPALQCPIEVGVCGIPETGQTNCYDPTGAIVACSGTGQDGELRKGVARDFTDNGDGTVTDEVTGLVWEKLSDDGSIHDKDATYTWADAFAVKVAALNADAFAGHSDWRVPNRNELETLVDAGTISPATFREFDTACTPGCTVLTCSCTIPSFYWSSTTGKTPTTFAWYVFFDGGFVDDDDKAATNSVRAVRGGP